MLKVLSITAAAAAISLAWAPPSKARAEGDLTVSAPVTHDNLAIYFVHGRSAGGPVPLTLQEGLATGSVVVRETGTVNRLEIENTSGEEVFIQAGDIVKGGRQDRVLAVSLLLPPKSGSVPIGAYCVEQGRWTARGKEDARHFASADKALPSREARMALAGTLLTAREPQPAAAVAGRSAAATQGPMAMEDRERILRQRLGVAEAQRNAPLSGGRSAQGEVWNSVAETQRKLSQNLQTAVAAAQSASSLQLSLENQKLADARAAYMTAIRPAGEKDGDIVGYVVAVNGRLTGAEIYPSNGLFRKMWQKQLDASATEAIGEKSAAKPAADLPSREAALAFIKVAESGEAKAVKLTAGLTREAREAHAAVQVETKRADGVVVHRSLIAKSH